MNINKKNTIVDESNLIKINPPSPRFFHPRSSEESQTDKENAIKYYRNKQDYPHANPDAVLEVMYLGADGNFKRKNY